MKLERFDQFSVLENYFENLKTNYVFLSTLIFAYHFIIHTYFWRAAAYHKTP